MARPDQSEPTIEELAPLQRRRRWPTYLVGLLILLIVLWLGYWFAATRVAAMALDRVTSSSVAGLDVGCPDRSLSGFPLRVDLRCQRATVSDSSDTIAAALSGFWASAPLYRPGFVEATLDSPLQVDVPGRGLALTASWSAGTATANAWLDGLAGGSGQFEGLSVDNTGRADALPITKLTAQVANANVMPAGGGNLRLTAAAQKVELTRSDGGPFPELDITASMTAVGAGSLGTDPVAALRRWVKAGGTLKVDDLKVSAAGAVLTASGSLSLSKDGLLNGSILFGFNSVDALGNLIETIRPGTMNGDTAKTALQAVNALSRSITLPDGTLIRQTSLTFTDGVIWLAFLPLPIAPVPPITF